MNADDLFIQSYLNSINENQRKKTLFSQEDRVIAEQKKTKLKFIDTFLQKFVDLEVYVEHHEKYNFNTKTKDNIVPQAFSFYYHDSSPPFAPGISIMMDHPALIEIAIPNDPIHQGVVIIKVSSSHPRSYLIEHSYTDYNSACAALGRFLVDCTTSVAKDPKKYIKDVEQRKQSHLDNGTENNLEQNEISFKKNQINEVPTLKEGQNNTTLKKIGDFFKVGKQNTDDDE